MRDMIACINRYIVAIYIQAIFDMYCQAKHDRDHTPLHALYIMLVNY